MQRLGVTCSHSVHVPRSPCHVPALGTSWVCPASKGSLGHRDPSSWHVVLPWQREGDAGAGLRPPDKVRRAEARGGSGTARSRGAVGRAGMTLLLGDLSGPGESRTRAGVEFKELLHPLA